MTWANQFALTLFTNDCAIARQAAAAGVDRIGLDLEGLGKDNRQAGRGAWVSHHEITELPAMRDAVSPAQLFVRTNPIYSGSEGEIEQCLEMGAEVLMLPMFRTVEEVEIFVRLIRGRALAIPLIETQSAAWRVRDICRVRGVDELHIGLNDLSIDGRLSSHFEMLVSPLMDGLCTEIARWGIPFGVGGIGRFHDAGLPIPPDLVLAQLPRLGATRSLVSRAFYGSGEIDWIEEVTALRQRLNEWHETPMTELEKARDRLADAVNSFLAQRAVKNRVEIIT